MNCVPWECVGTALRGRPFGQAGRPRRAAPTFLYGSLVLLFPVLASCNTVVPENRTKPDRAPQRIVSLVPNVTEMLFAFGAGDRVVAVSDYDRFPPEVFQKERVGALLNPNVEKILELKPDLVITYGTQQAFRSRLDAAGIRQYPFVHGTIEEMLQFMEKLGQVLDLEGNAKKVTAEIRTTLREIEARAPKRRLRVLLVHSRGPGVMGSFYTAGSEAHYHELMVKAGGENLFGDVEQEAFQPSMEEILKRQPEVIMELVAGALDAQQVRNRIKDWQVLATVPAVTHGRVYVLTDDYLLIAGPRLHLAARRFAEVIRGQTP